MDRSLRIGGVLALLLLAAFPARAVSVGSSGRVTKAGPPLSPLAGAAWADALSAFLSQPQPRPASLSALLAGLAGLDVRDPATRRTLQPLAEQARAGALGLLESLSAAPAPEALEAASVKLVLLDHPVFRALLADELLSRRVSEAAASLRSGKALSFAEDLAAELGKTPVVLYVDLEGKAPPRALVRADYLPRLSLRSVSATTKEGLRAGLKSALAAHEEVSHLVMIGHGASQSSGAEATLEFVLAEDDGIRLKVPSAEGRALDRTLPENQEAFFLFAGLRDRLAHGAKMFLIQCDLMQGNTAVAANKGAALLDLLGLEEGELYANRGAGISPWHMARVRALRGLGWAVSLAIAAFSAVAVVAAALAPAPEPSLLVLFAFFFAFAALTLWLFSGSLNRGYRITRRGGRVTLEKTTLARFLKTFSRSA